MMKQLSLFLILGLLNTSFSAKKVKDLQWFTTPNCQKLEIIKYKSLSDRKIMKQVTITDIDYIHSFQTQIESLPTSGDVMKKMSGDADYLLLEFSCKNQKEVVEFYNSQIKTPDTSFYLKAESHEKLIWEEIQNILATRELNKPIPLVKKMIHSFDHFTVEYLGSEDRTPKGTTASSYVASFKVISKKEKSEQKIEVRSGQLPPSPEKFKVGSDNLVLSTFKGKDGVSLTARTFIIYKD